MLNQMVAVADATATKNTAVTSPSVALVSVEQDDGEPQSGASSVISFSLPRGDNNNLTNLELKKTSDKNTVLQVRCKYIYI